MQIAGMQRDFHVLPQNVGQDHGRGPPPDHQAGLDLGPDGGI